MVSNRDWDDEYFYGSPDRDGDRSHADDGDGRFAGAICAPGLRVLIVGHTDSQGGLDYNVDLSRRRAASVIGALSARGILANRLTPQGVGMAAPVSTNDTDDGRARNRRVEMVKM
jgi:flagellar motor protein MotB